MMSSQRRSQPTSASEEGQVAGDVFFRAFGADDRAFLAHHTHIRRWSAGSMIFRSGDDADCLFAVRRGTVRVSLLTPQDRDLVLADLRPVEILGEIGLLDPRGRSADALALTNVELAVLGRAALFEFMERRPQAYRMLATLMASRVRNSDARTSEVAFDRLDVRIARVLLRRAGGEGTRERLPTTQTELARIANCSREALNRQLATWKRAGVIRVDAAGIVILDRVPLQQLTA